MPLVMVEEIPAISKASAKINPALFPNNGSSNDFACCSSSTCVFVLKKVAAANNIIALFIAHPTIMENNVS